MQAIKDFLKDEDGPTAVEYAVMLALITSVVVLSATNLGTVAAQSILERRNASQQLNRQG